MERVARPGIAAAAVLAVGGLIAATPVTPSLPDAQVADIHLTADSALSSDSILQGIADQQLDSNSALVVTDSLDANDPLVTDQEGFASDLGTLVPNLTDSQGPTLDVGPQFADASSLLAGVGGGLDPETFSGSLPFQPEGLGSGLGGFEGVAGQNAAVPSALAAAMSDIPGDHAIATAMLAEAAAFNEALLAQETAFNNALVESEQALQGAVFGDDNALNPVVDRAFNMFNMIYAIQQQGVNGLLGVEYNPHELAQLLLLTDDPDSDQFQALMAAIAGLEASDFKDAFANFNPEEFQTALGEFLTTVGGGPFGDAFDLGDGAPLADFLAGVGDIFAGVTP